MGNSYDDAVNLGLARVCRSEKHNYSPVYYDRFLDGGCPECSRIDRKLDINGNKIVIGNQEEYFDKLSDIIWHTGSIKITKPKIVVGKLRLLSKKRRT